MNQNDYVILFDENGSPYIAHAGWLDNTRNAVSNTAQQVVNQTKGVGRGVRQNHKYILKVNENGRPRYFYKQEEVQAYYEAKRKGIKNPAEYAQKAANAASNAVDAVKNATSKAVNTARNAVREATGQAARDRMDEAAAKYPELKQNLDKQNAALKDKEAKTGTAAAKYLNSVGAQMQADIKAQESNIFNRKARKANLESAKAQTEQYERAYKNAQNEEHNQRAQRDQANDEYGLGKLQYESNKRAYDKSLAGAVDRTAAAASSAYNKAKDSANNTVSNAKNAYERMKGEFRDRAEQAGNAVKSAANKAVDKAKDIAGYDEKERLDKATDIRNRASENAKDANKYISDALRSSKDNNYDDRFDAAIKIRDERLKAADNANADYWRAREAYDKTPLGMVNRAKAQVSSAADSVRDKAEEAVEKLSGIPKAVEKLSGIPKAAKTAAEDAAFNVEYYSEQLKDGITGEKAATAAARIREEAKDWKARADGVTNKELKDFYERNANQAEELAKRFDEEAAKTVKGRITSAANSVQGMIDNARSSTAKAVNEAWDKIPKNADGTVNPFDKNFQFTYNDWKAKKDKYDSSLAGRAKDAAEKATDSVKDMIDQAKKAAKNTATSAQNALDNATGNNYRKRAQEANQAAENAINQRARTSDQLENQRSRYGSKTNDSDHIYGDSEGYYYKTKEQRDRAEALISKRDQYDADIVNNNRVSKVNDSMYASSKAGKINDILGRSNVSTSERANSKATEVQNKWDRQEAESKLVGGRIEPDTNVSKEYVYSRASNSGMAGQVRQVMQLEEAMRDAERSYDSLGNDSSKPHSSSRAARQKMLQAQDAYEKAYEELIDDINKQYDRDLAAYEKQYGKYNR